MVKLFCGLTDSSPAVPATVICFIRYQEDYFKEMEVKLQIARSTITQEILHDLYHCRPTTHK